MYIFVKIPDFRENFRENVYENNSFPQHFREYVWKTNMFAKIFGFRENLRLTKFRKISLNFQIQKSIFVSTLAQTPTGSGRKT
jgi:hypothetical protein